MKEETLRGGDVVKMRILEKINLKDYSKTMKSLTELDDQIN